MTQYITLNVKLSNSQLNKLKSGIKNGTKVTLNLSSNLIGNSNYEINFPHKLSLTDTQVSMIRKAFANDSSANKKFSPIQLSKMIQSGGLLIRDIPIFGSILSSAAKKGTDMTRNFGKYFLDKKIDKFNKEYITGKDSGTTLTNNKIKHIMNVIKPLELEKLLKY